MYSSKCSLNWNIFIETVHTLCSFMNKLKIILSEGLLAKEANYYRMMWNLVPEHLRLGLWSVDDQVQSQERNRVTWLWWREGLGQEKLQKKDTGQTQSPPVWSWVLALVTGGGSGVWWGMGVAKECIWTIPLSPIFLTFCYFFDFMDTIVQYFLESLNF